MLNTINNKNKILLEQAGQFIDALITKIGKQAVGVTIKNYLAAAVSDLSKSSAKISSTMLKNNVNYQKAMLTAIKELTEQIYPPTKNRKFSSLTKQQQDAIANEVGVAFRDGVVAELEKLGKTLDDDIIRTSTDLANARAAGNVADATKLSDELIKLQKTLNDINTNGLQKINAMSAPTRNQIAKLLNQNIKSGKIKRVKLIKINPKDGLKYFFNKKTKKMVPNNGSTLISVWTIPKFLVKSLIYLGLFGYGIYWFMSLLAPDDENIAIVDEDGNPIDWREDIESGLEKCVDNLTSNGAVILQQGAEGNFTFYLSLNTTGNEEYDSHGGLLFFLDGIVTYGDKTRRGRWACSLTGDVESLDESNNKLSLLQLIEQAQENRWDDGITIEWDVPQTNEPETNETQPQQDFTDCSTWDISVKPYTLGCRAQKIRYIQDCLGDEPLDGIFDERLLKALGYSNIDASNGITKEIFDEVMERCKQPTQQTTQQPTQEPTQSSNLNLTDLAPAGETQTSLDFKENNSSGENESGGDFYGRMYKYGYFRDGKLGDRKIRYRDSPLSKQDYDKLTQYFSQYGYVPYLTKAVDDEVYKYQWIKRK